MLKEYREKAKGFSDLLNYCLFIEEGILLLKDGGLCFGIYYRGADLGSANHEEIANLSAQLNIILRQLGQGWMLHCDLIRKESCDYVNEENCHFPDPLSRFIDNERRKHYLEKGNHFETVYSMVFTYRPPLEVETKFKKIFVNSNNKTATWQQILQYFSEKRNYLINSLKRIFYIESMRSENLLNHLLWTIRGEVGEIKLPNKPFYVDCLLGHQELFAGFYPKLEDRHVRVISMIGFPLESYPGLLQRLEQITFSFRWSNRYIFVDKSQALKILKYQRRYWFQNRHSMLHLMREALFPNQTANITNRDAESMAEDVTEAMTEVESGLVNFGYYTSVIVCHHANEDILNEGIKQILKELENCGFLGKVETINTLEAYLGSLPGHGYQNLRRPLIHTLNLADFIPLSGVWAGMTTHPSAYYGKNAPPLFYGVTSGATPFRFYLHHQDVGHTLIVGDTGSGKSTLVGLIALQHLRYQNAQVYLFDKGYSSYILSQAIEGEHYDLASNGKNPTFCPLQDINDPDYLSYALEWLEILFQCQGIELSVVQRKEVQCTLERLKNNDKKSLTHFQSALQDETLKAAIDYYTLSGPMGQTLDAMADELSSKHFQVFEMTYLLERSQAAIIPTIAYLFFQIERKLKGQPTLIIIEEGHRFLSGKFGQRIDLWLRELRKKNTAVIFLTQHLSEVINSESKHIIINNCKTKIFLPNPHAGDKINAEIYYQIGLSEVQMQIIKYAIPKKDYYYTSPSGSRLIDLSLDKLALSFIGVDSEKERAIVDDLIKKHGNDWVYYWLCQRGLNEYAEEYQRKKL